MKKINLNEKLTIIIVSFHSDHIIENLISSIDEDIKIVVIENSLDEALKLKLEKKYQNVQVVIPKKNLGVGGGINLGFNHTKTQFALHLSADTIPDKEMIKILLRESERIKKFAILAPKMDNFYYEKDFYIEKDNIKKIHKMRWINGSALLFNMETLNITGRFDENIFLYYEEHDMYFRILKFGLNIYMIEEARIVHLGSSGVTNVYKKEISFIRNWHYCWSKFYHFKKNYGYLHGIKKTFPNLIRSIKKCIICIFKIDTKNFRLHKAEIEGLFASYFLKKSWRRPDIK
tara:strand:- start:1271 stop:2137 length:867 start_codon:yes stop_codon:yes gene_type:complete